MSPRNPVRLVICSKSRWDPAIRREHALAHLAARAGVPVTFVERPRDIRTFASLPRAVRWHQGRGTRRDGEVATDGVSVVPTSVVVPGHRSNAAEASSGWLLERTLRGVADLDRATVVANVPWQWPAVAAVGGARRVFDCADDWSAQIPRRRGRLLELYARIAREADAIILASPEMVDRFPAGRAVIVRNGVSEHMLAPTTARPGDRRMVYAGTLSPRFDAPLAAKVLAALPGWTLDIYGQCQYPGRGARPGEELGALLSSRPAQVRYLGVAPRAELASAIDRAAVAVVLNRPDRSAGQDSMKLYDYAARGRPIVCTRFARTLEHEGPPHLRLADTPAEFAAAVQDSLSEAPRWATQRREWAEQQRWERRWPVWAQAIFG